MPSGDILTTLKHKAHNSIHVVFSHDGGFLATAEAVARLVATSTGQELVQATCTTPCSFVRFSHDDKFVAFGSLGGTVSLFATEPGRLVAQFEQAGMPVGFSRDGQWLATVYPRGLAQLWATADGKQVRRITPASSNDWARFSPDLRFLALMCRNTGTIRLLATKSGEEITAVEHSQHAWAKFSPDGRFMVTASVDGTVRLVSTETGNEVVHLTHTGPLGRLSFSHNSQALLAVSENGDGSLVNSVTGHIVAPVKIPPTEHYNITFSPLSRFVALQNGKGETRLLATKDGREVAKLPPTGNGIIPHGLVFSPDELFLGVNTRASSYHRLPSVRIAGFSPPAARMARYGGSRPVVTGTIQTQLRRTNRRQ
jgi:hypothetical protein